MYDQRGVVSCHDGRRTVQILYYLTGRHFTVVTDHASLTWLHNFRKPEGMVARWISRLQPFDFAIVHRPDKHHSHADGLSRRTSRPCKREASSHSRERES